MGGERRRKGSVAVEQVPEIPVAALLAEIARRRLGDPEFGVRRRRREAVLAAEREQRSMVVDHLIATDDSEMKLMSMLRGADLQGALDDESGVPGAEPDALAGPFAHVVVDEAQELTDAEWQMLLQRCPSGSMTVVGDRAQARHGFPESWNERLERVGLHRARTRSLTPGRIFASSGSFDRSRRTSCSVPRCSSAARYRSSR